MAQGRRRLQGRGGQRPLSEVIGLPAWLVRRPTVLQFPPVLELGGNGLGDRFSIAPPVIGAVYVGEQAAWQELVVVPYLEPDQVICGRCRLGRSLWVCGFRV